MSCAPSTPEYRISERPQVFQGLSEREKDLVRRGEIAKGMEMGAVTIAWGAPSNRFEGLRDGKQMERWDYEGSRAVMTNHFYGGYRTGYQGANGYSGLGVGYGPEITHIPYRKSTVWFVAGREDEWERVK